MTSMDCCVIGLIALLFHMGASYFGLSYDIYGAMSEQLKLVVELI